MPISKTKKAHRIANNLCVRCGTNPPTQGHQQCDRCRAYVAACYARSTASKRSIIKKQRVLTGKCRCGKPARTGSTSCEHCLTSQSKSAKNRADKALAHGFCAKCKTHPVKPGHHHCPDCLEIRRLKQIEKRSQCKVAGICRSCSARPHMPDHTLCAKCRLQRLEHYCSLKRNAFNAYGGPICRCCGETIFEFLTIDHIDGGGSKHRQIIGNAIYRWLKHNNYPPGFQVLCFNCNASKGGAGECPHKRALTGTDYCI